MIRFGRVNKPSGFENVERRGATWLAEHPGASRPYDLWSDFKGHLADGFMNLCGYSAMYEPVGTIDHFVSYDEAPARAYDWENYRFCAAWFNSSKKKLRASEVLDPFEVEDDWFEVLLPSLELVATAALPSAFATQAKTMLKRLGNDERVMRQRRAWHKRYQLQQISLDVLAEFAPLIARAVEKQQGKAKLDHS